MEDVITNALAYVKGRRKQRRVEIDIPEEMLLVKMDGKMIVQVLINLLDNAIKHTKEDGVILIKAQKEDKGVWFMWRMTEPVLKRRLRNGYLTSL